MTTEPSPARKSEVVRKSLPELSLLELSLLELSLRELSLLELSLRLRVWSVDEEEGSAAHAGAEHCNACDKTPSEVARAGIDCAETDRVPENLPNPERMLSGQFQTAVLWPTAQFLQKTVWRVYELL